MSFGSEDEETENYAIAEAPELPINAMIDIFAMIVIFLVLGSVFGAADIPLPAGVTLPKSQINDSVILAPQITLTGENVEFDFLAYKIDRKTLALPASADYRRAVDDTKAYLSKVPLEVKTGQNPINIVADAETPYLDVYYAVRLVREAGFENVLFLSSFE